MASSSTIDYLGNRDSPDYVYYNATIVNNNTSTTSLVDDPEIVFQDNRKQPLLKDASKYVLSVENFALNGAAKLLPLLIPQIVTPISDINVTIYTITFTALHSGNYYQSTHNLIWETEDSSSFVTIPQTGTTTQTESPYYYLYSYQRFVTILNKALKAAWDDVKTLIGVTFVTHCPFFTYNDANGTFTLFQDVNTSIVPYGDTLPPPHNVASATSGYTTGDFTFVGYDSNLEGLINNLATQYYGSNAILDFNGSQSLTVLSKVPTPIPTAGAVVTNYTPPTSAPPYQLYFVIAKTLLTTVPYTFINTDAFYYPAAAATLQYIGTGSVTIAANVRYGILDGITSPLWVFKWSDGTILPNTSDILSEIVLPQTITFQANASPISLPVNSFLLQLVTGLSPKPIITLNTGVVYFPNNVVQVDLIASLPTSVVNTGLAGHLYLQQNTGGIVNPFTNTVISIADPVYVGTTEYQSSTDTLWSPVGSFVMTTTYVPVINEFSSNPIVLGSANTGFAQDSGSAFGRILIEDAVDTDKLDYYKYQPLTPTMSSFSPSHEPLNTIDFRFLWRNRLTNSLIPMKLPNSGTVTVRLLFKKKGAE